MNDTLHKVYLIVLGLAALQYGVMAFQRDPLSSPLASLVKNKKLLRVLYILIGICGIYFLYSNFELQQYTTQEIEEQVQETSRQALEKAEQAISTVVDKVKDYTNIPVLDE